MAFGGAGSDVADSRVNCVLERRAELEGRKMGAVSESGGSLTLALVPEA